MKNTQMHTTAHAEAHFTYTRRTHKLTVGVGMEEWIDQKGEKEIDIYLTDRGMDGLRDGRSDRLA